MLILLYKLMEYRYPVIEISLKIIDNMAILL